jgi:predicted transcriptional regulator
MKLDKWIRDNNLSNVTAGKLFGVSRAIVSHWRNDKRMPGRLSMERIKSATDWRVTEADFDTTSNVCPWCRR